MKNKIKLGLLINSFELPLWEYILIKRLIKSNYASVELIIVNEGQDIRKSLFNKIKNNWRNIILILFNKIDQKLFKIQPNAFKQTDTKDLLNEIPIINTKPISTKYSDRLTEEDILKIKHYNLDVLIRFGFKILRGDILKSAKYGIWSYHHGDNDLNRGGPAGFWEVIEHWDITGTTLQILSEDLDGGKLLYKSFSKTDRRSIHRNRNNFYWKSLSFLPRKLEELYSLGETEFFNRVNIQNKYPTIYFNKLFRGKNLNNWKMIKFITNNIIRLLKDKLIYSIYFDQWIILFSIKKGISSSFWRFKKIIPPKDRFFADPFIIQNKNKYYIFIEEFMYKTNKGHISVIEMDEKGNYNKPVRVIDKSYHLSYPFVFKNKDNYFLIPDSRSNKTIELYKCVEFPFRWELKMNLMENIEAVDTTLFYHQNKWWLFTNIVENPGASSWDELFLFYAEKLHTKDWISHPMNPIVSDVRKSRPAGNIFIHNGRIIRPSQNCSKCYGYGIKLNEIIVLNKNEYNEVEINSIEPNWEKRIKATHTFNHRGNLTVIDGRLRRSLYI